MSQKQLVANPLACWAETSPGSQSEQPVGQVRQFPTASGQVIQPQTPRDAAPLLDDHSQSVKPSGWPSSSSSAQPVGHRLTQSPTDNQLPTYRDSCPPPFSRLAKRGRWRRSDSQIRQAKQPMAIDRWQGLPRVEPPPPAAIPPPARHWLGQGHRHCQGTPVCSACVADDSKPTTIHKALLDPLDGLPPAQQSGRLHPGSPTLPLRRWLPASEMLGCCPIVSRTLRVPGWHPVVPCPRQDR